MRATVSYEPDDEPVMDAWFDRWETALAVSDDQGCGCCVHIFDVDGPPEAFAALPPGVSVDTADG